MRISPLKAAALLAGFLVGCQPPPPANSIVGHGIYTGPTETIAKVVGDINSNNQKIPSLWASHDYEATVVGDDKQAHFVNGSGVLLYRSGSELRLVGEKDLIGTVFDLGTNSKSFWMKVVPEVDTLWYGKYAELRPESQSLRQMPIEPDLILRVLAVAPIDSNLNNQPAPVMRFNNDADAYMLVWSVQLPDRWVAQREVWYDRRTKNPLFVFLFDGDGRVVLRAQLSAPRAVEVEGTPESQWPHIATQYRLLFPESGSRMNIWLKDLRLSKGSGARSVPNDRSFTPPDPAHAGVGHAIQIR